MSERRADPTDDVQNVNFPQVFFFFSSLAHSKKEKEKKKS